MCTTYPCGGSKEGHFQPRCLLPPTLMVRPNRSISDFTFILSRIRIRFSLHLFDNLHQVLDIFVVAHQLFWREWCTPVCSAASKPGSRDIIRANGTSQTWTPLRMLHASGRILRKLTKYLPSTRLQDGQWTREFIDYKTSKITDEDSLRGLMFDQDLGFSHTLHARKERRRRCIHPHLRERGRPICWSPATSKSCSI